MNECRTASAAFIDLLLVRVVTYSMCMSQNAECFFRLRSVAPEMDGRRSGQTRAAAALSHLQRALTLPPQNSMTQIDIIRAFYA
jgi:hypothetical protein